MLQPLLEDASGASSTNYEEWRKLCLATLAKFRKQFLAKLKK